MTTIRALHGDCRPVMTTLPPDSFDACVTDPPYELAFMGRRWDRTKVAFDPATWRTVYRVLKPGAHLVAFGGTRTYHRMVCAIEDAGFEVRDTLCWLYGSGFTKSADFAGMRDETRVRVPKPEFVGHPQAVGFGTALKPAHEPVVLARKPLVGTVGANVLGQGVGGLNIDACRIEGRERTEYGLATAIRTAGSVYGEPSASADFDASKGRWPANVCHDGSDEVLAAFAAFGERKSGGVTHQPKRSGFSEGWSDGTNVQRAADTGTAARFFYSSKANKADRAGSSHPTVKPVSLMRWLTRLVTPPGGHVLDPFAGSGTTGEAARLEGFDCTMIEQDEGYIQDINRRLGRAAGVDTPLLGVPAE